MSPSSARLLRSTQYFASALARLSLPASSGRLQVVGAFRASDRPDLAEGRILRHAVRDEVHRIVTRHVLHLQEVRGVTLPFREDRHQQVRAGHFRPAGTLHVNDCPLDDTREGAGRRCLHPVDVRDKHLQFVVDVADQGASQLPQIDVAGLHHARGVPFVDQCEQEMLQGRVLVPTRVRIGDCRVDRGF